MMDTSEVPDPYYGGRMEFEATYRQLLPACQELLTSLSQP